MSAIHNDLLDAVPKVSTRRGIRSLPIVAAIGIGFAAYAGGVATVKLAGTDPAQCSIAAISPVMSSDELSRRLADINRKLNGAAFGQALAEADRALRSIDLQTLPRVSPSLAIDGHGLGRVEGR
jgi:hypothetical protein